MADDDQQAPQQRYWFPYWTSPPAPAAPRPGLRQQPSRRDTRPAQPQPPPVTPSPSRRHPQAAATAASTRGAGSPQAQPQPQPTRLSSRPSPARTHPLSPIGEPNSRAAPAPAAAPKDTKPSAIKPVQPVAHEEIRKELDIVVPQEKIIHEPPSDTKAHSKAVEKEEDGKEKHREKKEKEKEHKEKKEKNKDGKEKDEKEKEKERKEKKDKHKEVHDESGKLHKEKKEKDKDGKEKEKKEKDEKEKEKEHKEKKDKHKEVHDESKVRDGKLHKELKAGVADMVHKLGATTAPTAGHGHHASGVGTTVITLAGENKGASMKVSHTETESKDAKERRARKLDDGKQEAHGAKGLTAFVNSNVQVVNNSLVFQSSCNSSDPGVHLKLSTKSKKKGDGEEAGGGKGGAAVVAKRVKQSGAVETD